MAELQVHIHRKLVARTPVKRKEHRFTSKCASLIKEQRARIYVLRRCATMLLCWYIHGDESSSMVLWAGFGVPITSLHVSGSMFFYPIGEISNGFLGTDDVEVYGHNYSHSNHIMNTNGAAVGFWQQFIKDCL